MKTKRRSGAASRHVLGGLLVLLAATPLIAGETGKPQWIWYNEGNPAVGAPAGVRYFRKVVELAEPATAKLDVTCDNHFVLFVNGTAIGRGDTWEQGQSFTVPLPRGRVAVAVRATNDGAPAGLYIKAAVTPSFGTPVRLSTDGSWKAERQEHRGWTEANFDDSAWPQALALGEAGKPGLPWTRVAWPGNPNQFQAPGGFSVHVIASPQVTGSIVCMCLDERGRIIVARENGPIFVLEHPSADGTYQSARQLSTKLTNCQGLRFLDGSLYAVGNGPEGTAVYRLRDPKHDDHYDAVTVLGKFQGSIGEHGPHAVVWGPDGMLYLILGNFAQPGVAVDPKSPFNRFTEGQLLPPYPDPRGFATALHAPGGTILRMDRDGRHWQRIAGGFRNAYDLSFDRRGEIWTFDSDMEWDIGLPWYRPVRFNHVVPGGEYGWRTGSGKWPEYYPDSLPATANVGRGSPTGTLVYDHVQFPAAYQGALFACDWSQGRILAVHPSPAGATYDATVEVFLTGQPCNATYLEVAPDGSLLFSTGGRGTQGGVYRVSYDAARAHSPRAAAPPISSPATVAEALGQPQILAPWARARVQAIRQALGPRWAHGLEAVARDARRPAGQRWRALDLLEQFGPAPRAPLGLALAADHAAEIRAYAARILGQDGAPAALDGLTRLLRDPDAWVRRRACEGFVQAQHPPDPRALLPLLADPDRWVRYAARVALQTVEPARWRAAAIHASNPDTVIQAVIALNLLGQKPAELAELLRVQAAIVRRRPADRRLLDLLRSIALTLINQRPAPPRGAESLAMELLRRFPTADWRTNREIARVVADLHPPAAAARIWAELRTETGHAQQIHYAYCLRTIRAHWPAGSPRQFMAWAERAQAWEGGFSFSGYIEDIATAVVPRLSPADRKHALAAAATAPFTARLIIHQADVSRHPELVWEFEALYTRVKAARDTEAIRALKDEIIEAVARSSDASVEPWLRRVFQLDPASREVVARHLARNPSAENLPLLVEVLATAGPSTAQTCLHALAESSARPPASDAAAFRAVILAGQKLGAAGARDAVRTLRRWTGQDGHETRDQGPAALAGFEHWYAEKFRSESLQATAAGAAAHPSWTYSSLLAFIESPQHHGSAERGKPLFRQAKCMQCHRMGNEGEGIGPDLSAIGKRFKRRDILESIVDPSKVISDQYRSLTVATTDGRVLTGLPGRGADPKSLMLIQSDGTKVTIPRDSIEETKPSSVSLMPEGLINDFTPEQVADLIAYLEKGA